MTKIILIIITIICSISIYCYGNTQQIPNISIIAIIELSNNPKAVNVKSGALGLCQIMPKTWNEFATKNEKWDNANDNKAVSKRYFTWIRKALKRYGDTNYNNINHQLAAYNWGIGNFKEVNFNLSRVPRETKLYIEKYNRLKK
jgi:soluble lytic murein transglycosylase-like protein